MDLDETVVCEIRTWGEKATSNILTQGGQPTNS